MMMYEFTGLEYLAGTGRLQMREKHNFIPGKVFTKQFLRGMDH